MMTPPLIPGGHGLSTGFTPQPMDTSRPFVELDKKVRFEGLNPNSPQQNPKPTSSELHLSTMFPSLSASIDDAVSPSYPEGSSEAVLLNRNYQQSNKINLQNSTPMDIQIKSKSKYRYICTFPTNVENLDEEALLAGPGTREKSSENKMDDEDETGWNITVGQRLALKLEHPKTGTLSYPTLPLPTHCILAIPTLSTSF